MSISSTLNCHCSLLFYRCLWAKEHDLYEPVRDLGRGNTFQGFWGLPTCHWEEVSPTRRVLLENQASWIIGRYLVGSSWEELLCWRYSCICVSWQLRSHHSSCLLAVHRGVGAMEIVAMDMKVSGMYIARQLSFSGVSFRIEEIALDEEFKVVYNKAARLVRGWVKPTVLQKEKACTLWLVY